MSIRTSYCYLTTCAQWLEPVCLVGEWNEFTHWLSRLWVYNDRTLSLNFTVNVLAINKSIFHSSMFSLFKLYCYTWAEVHRAVFDVTSHRLSTNTEWHFSCTCDVWFRACEGASGGTLAPSDKSNYFRGISREL